MRRFAVFSTSTFVEKGFEANRAFGHCFIPRDSIEIRGVVAVVSAVRFFPVLDQMRVGTEPHLARFATESVMGSTVDFQLPSAVKFLLAQRALESVVFPVNSVEMLGQIRLVPEFKLAENAFELSVAVNTLLVLGDVTLTLVDVVAVGAFESVPSSSMRNLSVSVSIIYGQELLVAHGAENGPFQHSPRVRMEFVVMMLEIRLAGKSQVATAAARRRRFSRRSDENRAGDRREFFIRFRSFFHRFLFSYPMKSSRVAKKILLRIQGLTAVRARKHSAFSIRIRDVRF